MIGKALIIGSGFLGSYVLEQYGNRKIPSIGTHNNSERVDTVTVDVRSEISIEKCIQKIKPDLLINCAAIGKIDYLESHPDLAYSINSEGAKNLAIISKKYNIRLVHISTDSIFDGKKGMYTEEDLPNPLNVYAKSKVLSEKFVKEKCDNYVIVRTNFYGYNSRGDWFFNWVLAQLKNENSMVGFTDIIFNPLEVSNLSEIILELGESDYQGIINISSNDVINKYQFILETAKVFGYNSDLVKEGSFKNHPTTITIRPFNTSLDNTKAKSLLNSRIISLRESLEKIKGRLENVIN